ncbi:hypothetical protein [Carboxylicivirga sp. RSCT41]|uniref:hypothetical protein n=1 Tax=Carboxylicivirga agarovorans TaxID=3417570 RepID=UPI003D336384
MDEKSNRRGYLFGILVAVGIVVIGYILNPIIGILGIVNLLWPQNLYFVLLLAGIGMVLGLMSESVTKKVTNHKMLLPSVVALGILAVFVLLKPNGFDSIIMNKMLATPALLLSIVVFVAGGAFVSAKLRFFKNNWSQILSMIAFLLFSYSTVVSQHDYYRLSMRIGTDRTLFEAEDSNGKYYRLPFAVKLLPEVEGGSETLVRFFKTVDDFIDVNMNSTGNYRLKGWDIRKDNASEVNSGHIDLKLIFDRWIELKYISLGLLIISLIIRLKY